MTESDRTKLVILLHQYTPAERLTAMEIRTVLEFIEGRGFTILAPKEDQVTEALSRFVKVEPPRSWPKEQQLLFLSLPTDTQRYLQTREKDRDVTIRRLQNDAALWRKHLEEIKKGTDHGTIENQPSENPA